MRGWLTGALLGMTALSGVVKAAVINVGSTGSSTIVALEPGEYEVAVVGGGWNAWGGATGVDPFTGEFRGWLSAWSATTSGGASFGQGSGRYGSPGTAIAHANPVIF